MVQYHRTTDACYTGEIPEDQVHAEVKKGLTAFGFLMLDFAQGRETQQTEGIPDLYALHAEWGVCAWVEVKRPHLVIPGIRPGTTKILQQGGKWSWPQEELHRRLQAAGAHVVTVDSGGEALAYFAYLGYPVPSLAYRQPFDPAAQARFRDPRAYQKWEALKLRQAQARIYRPRPKRGPRVPLNAYARPSSQRPLPGS